MTPDQERDGLARGIPPAWASAWGEDEFGVFACFEVGGVEVRMRWIERGEFTMGSPATEVGRFDREGPQHEVTLKHGFWLADTPCTQDVWVAVMGNNPSAYQSSRRPVEQVSWNDVQRFLEKVNEAVPGLEAGLPTEAQWEYACRAGTDTKAYGELDDVAWYSGNSSGETHDVGLKRPNPWGLYDMLGNVWEWCADSLRQYTNEPVTDPEGTRGPERVDRGGSWDSSARLCRAAYRGWLDPGHRSGDLGFRLSRGQGLRPAQPGPEG